MKTKGNKWMTITHLQISGHVNRQVSKCCLCVMANILLISLKSGFQSGLNFRLVKTGCLPEGRKLFTLVKVQTRNDQSYSKKQQW